LVVEVRHETKLTGSVSPLRWPTGLTLYNSRKISQSTDFFT